VRRYRRKTLRRPPSPSWNTFLKNHAPHIWALDLFTVQTLTFRSLYVIVFIAHDRRRIVHVNVTRHPTAARVWRQVIEATPWGEMPKHLIRDRDRCYATDFIAKAARIGINTVLTPVRAPNANAVAEREDGGCLVGFTASTSGPHEVLHPHGIDSTLNTFANHGERDCRGFERVV